MQLRLYKKSTIILFFVIIATLLSTILLISTRNKWGDNALIILIGYFIGVSGLNMAFAYYDTKTDQKIIKKMVTSGHVALAYAKEGRFIRYIRDARLNKFILWEIDITLYDHDMQAHNTTMIEKFNITQTSIPSGHFYVTYNPEKPDDILLIPNVLISSIGAYQPLAMEYEKVVKPKYLNSFYRYGNCLQTYEQSLKEQREKEEKNN
ncbi:MAG TPA: hypothetical protein PLT36_07220 [Erysipelotrichaceae bacterium]|nr:hypothetical protein [Erysipelotrichia bacterium]HPX33277.1 hypothetical protein [Erysipelotrichaceae bacterium]HQA85748.1 hypothetical protein [Erysipelotrichaceae bacterium]